MCRRIEVTAGFWLLLAAAYYFMDAAIVLLTVPSVALHELAHYAALRLCGAEVRRVRLTAFGAEMQIENEMALSYGREIFCAAAGPLCNIVLALISALLAEGNEVFLLLAGINGVQAAFNLLPFEASDGGRMLRAALCGLLGLETGERVSGMTGGFCAAAVLLFSAWVMLKTGGNGFLLLGAIGLILPMRKRCLKKGLKPV
ncbi:MAG: hypothetical protein IKU12_05915 [Oscillospiraceae bacterium]|nr:hypothetical protein [Oscillospiraceae bacterium]